jgi:allantoinase
MLDLIVKSKNVVVANEMKEAFVLIKDGRIVDVVAALSNDATVPLVDAENKIVMAGVIDPHVHINEPGRTDWEGFETATKAAVAGGLTTLVDMPLNASPVTTSVAAFREKLSAAKKNLHTHCGFWGGLVPGNEREIEPLIEEGVLGFKAFLTHSGMDEFPNVTESDLQKAMPILARHQLPLLVHCEISGHETHSQKPRSYQGYLASRPKKWEDEAIALMIRLCEQYGCRTHIVHLSSAGSIDQIQQAKAGGLPLTVETAQHYLYFNAEEISDGETQYKCAPPIRERENNALLWEALTNGTIDFVATDHSPAPPLLKQMETGDFTRAWGGISSLQFALPVLWTAAKARSATPGDIARWLAEKPAALIGKNGTKGKIQRGYDADLVIWDPDKQFTVTPDIIQHRHKITPYLHNTLFGVVEQTYLGGKKVFDNGSFTALHSGKLITR